MPSKSRLGKGKRRYNSGVRKLKPAVLSEVLADHKEMIVVRASHYYAILLGNKERSELLVQDMLAKKIEHVLVPSPTTGNYLVSVRISKL